MHAAHGPDYLPHPLHVLLTGAGVDYDQVVVLAQLVQHHVVDKGAVRVEHRGVVRLAGLELGGVVHQQLLHGRQRVGSAQLNVAHMADVENAYARAHGGVLGHQTRVLHRHIPTAEVHHAGLVPVVRGVECCPAQQLVGKGSIGDRHIFILKKV